MTDAETKAQDALAIAQKAMQKANEVDEMKDEMDELKDELVALKLRVSEMDEDRSYEQLTLDEKVGKVREHAFKKATQRNGKATLDYSDVMWEVFDGNPGNNHCYNLIRRAAGLEGDKETGSEYPGFTARDPDSGSFHLAVDADRAKANAEFYSRNKAEPAGAD